MFIYFWILRLLGALGHAKARKIVKGQRQAMATLREWREQVGQARILWMHVASVGEFEQARPIIERLRHDVPTCKILLTFFSSSGYEMRKDYDKVDKVLYLPFATMRNAKRWLRLLQPELAVFVKYEFWPAYLKALKKNGVPTYLISAIFRPRQLFFMPWGGFYRRLLHCFQHIYVQDQASAVLLQKFGVNHVTVAGDTRFDRVVEVCEAAKELPVIQGFVGEQSNVLIAGSTWPEEEQMLARYVAERENVRLILVPHELQPKHIQQIFQYFEGRYVCYSDAIPMSVSMARVLLVDKMGLLSSIYRYGQVAYIGGGFGAGIHNTLEAAVYGMPVVFGPKWQKFREARGLQEVGAAISVNNYRELAAALDVAFENKEIMGQKANDYVQRECGATDIIYNALFSTLKNNSTVLDF